MEKTTEAILYPDRILISTYNFTVTGFRIPTDIITWLSNKVSDKELGEVIRKHLKQSIKLVPDSYNRRTLTSMYAKATGLKTIKLQMENAKLVSILDNNKRLMFIPTENRGAGYNRGYHNLLWEVIVSDKKITNEKLGELVKDRWNKCK